MKQQVKACDVRGRGYAPKGKTPVVRRTEKKKNVSMISAITNQGKVFWRLHEGSVNAEKVLDFIKRLTKSAGRKIFIILDNAKTHHSKAVSSWAEMNSDKVEIYYLPPYSPDLNPDEYVNSDVKYGVGVKMPKRTKEALREATQSHMKMLKKNPDRIKKYFEDTAIFLLHNVIIYIAWSVKAKRTSHNRSVCVPGAKAPSRVPFV